MRAICNHLPFYNFVDPRAFVRHMVIIIARLNSCVAFLWHFIYYVSFNFALYASTFAFSALIRPIHGPACVLCWCLGQILSILICVAFWLSGERRVFFGINIKNIVDRVGHFVSPLCWEKTWRPVSEYHCVRTNLLGTSQAYHIMFPRRYWMVAEVEECVGRFSINPRHPLFLF